MLCTGVAVGSIRWRHVKVTEKFIDRRSEMCQQCMGTGDSGAASQRAGVMRRQRRSKQSGAHGSSQALEGGVLGSGGEHSHWVRARERVRVRVRVGQGKMMLDGSMLQMLRAAGFKCCRVWCVVAVLQGRA